MFKKGWHSLMKNVQKPYIAWIIYTTLFTIIALALFASITIYIDPLFHYHKPLVNYEYPINNERYQNDGITQHFEYDGIITGTSMSENFKTSEADKMFHVSFIKVCFSGGRLKEINDILRRAYDADKSIKYVIESLDYYALVLDKDAYKEGEYPVYLYNNNPFDDINYILNKSILLNYTINVIEYTKAGNQTTNFDNYTNWNDCFTYGSDTVLTTYTLGEKSNTKQAITDEDRTRILENIRQNITDLADAHPETIFYLFFPPYSICYWDRMDNAGQIDWRIDAEQIVIEEIVKHPNIKLFSFNTNFELICNLDNYKDWGHYGEWVNSQILEWMRDDEYLITEHNYKEYIETIREFYNSYEYDSLRE